MHHFSLQGAWSLLPFLAAGLLGGSAQGRAASHTTYPPTHEMLQSYEALTDVYSSGRSSLQRSAKGWATQNARIITQTARRLYIRLCDKTRAAF